MNKRPFEFASRRQAAARFMLMPVSIWALSCVLSPDDLSSAYQLQKDGEWQQSVHHFMRFSVANPDDPQAAEALFQAAEMSRLHLDHEFQARQLYQEILQKFPQSERAETAEMQLAEFSWNNVDRPDLTIAAYERILDRYPEKDEDERILFRLGQLHRKSRSYDGAVSYFERILEVSDNADQRALARIEMAQIFRLQKQPQMAEKMFQFAIDEAPGDEVMVDARKEFADLLIALGKHEEALEIVKEWQDHPIIRATFRKAQNISKEIPSDLKDDGP